MGFNDPILENFDMGDILSSMIKRRYDDHPRIITIKEPVLWDSHSILFMLSLVFSIWRVKSTGYFGIPVKFLMAGTDTLSMITSELTNLSIDECTFPDLPTYAELAALFTKLDSLCKENYRPVSILTVLSKAFGKMYWRQLTSYFDHVFSGFR